MASVTTPSGAVCYKPGEPGELALQHPVEQSATSLESLVASVTTPSGESATSLESLG